MVAILRCLVLASIVFGAYGSSAFAAGPSFSARQVAQANDDATSGDASGDTSSETDAEAEGDADAAAPKDAAAKKKKQPTLVESLVSSPLVIFLPLGLLFYFLMIRPQQKRSADMASMMKNLKKGDRVVTVGGIVGVVVNSQKDSDQVTLLIDEGSGAKLRVMRSHLARLYSETDKGTDKSRSDKEPAADLAGSDNSK